ncbi:MAG: sigma-70 family RNA polymerase sigma factor [bacterium]
MLRFKRGDILAFEMIMQKYQKSVLNVIYRLVGDQDRAEDLTQEVFVKVYRFGKRYKPKTRFSHWLYRIAINLSLNDLRQKRKYQVISLNSPLSFVPDDGKVAELVDQLIAPTPTPVEILQRRDLNGFIKKAVDSLCQSQKTMIILREYESLSYREMAKVLNCSIKSIEACLYRARQNLKEKLIPYLKSEGFL